MNGKSVLRLNIFGSSTKGDRCEVLKNASGRFMRAVVKKAAGANKGSMFSTSELVCAANPSSSNVKLTIRIDEMSVCPLAVSHVTMNAREMPSDLPARKLAQI